MMDNILITGARSAVALDMARDFQRNGYEVHMADCSNAFIARWSKAPHMVHRYESPNLYPERFTADISRLVKNIKPVLVIPTCEEVFHLARPSLQQCLQNCLFAPSLSVLSKLHGKDQFIELCKTSSINSIETHVLEDFDDKKPYRSNLNDWVFKPCFSRFGSQTLVAPTLEKFDKIVPSNKHSWIAQRRIHGQEISFYAIAKAGKLIALAAYSSKWRLNGGASYVFSPVSTEISTKIRLMAETIASGLSLTGQFSCDLIMDKEGVIWPIECNPRSTSGLHLLTGNGALAQAIINGSPIFSSTLDKPKYMLPMMLTHGLCQNSWSEWLEMLKNGSDVIGNPKDRMPMFGALADTCLFAAKGQLKGISLARATTTDIEWNGEELI